MLVQNKVPKQKDTPSRLFPALLTLMDVNRTRPSDLQKSQATSELKQAIDETSHEASAARRGRRGLVDQKQTSKADANLKDVIPAMREGCWGLGFDSPYDAPRM